MLGQCDIVHKIYTPSNTPPHREKAGESIAFALNFYGYLLHFL